MKAFAVVLVLLCSSLFVSAYVVKETPPPSIRTMNLQLGCPMGGPCWDDVAAQAIQEWNTAGSNFRFQILSPSQPADPCDLWDGISTIGWTDNFCGLSRRVGPQTLGFVLPGDQDLVLNQRLTWDVYRGPWHPSQPPDLHRTILHELGHIVGLKHPDEHGQTVVALMNSQYGDIDELQADDINGAIALHGIAREAEGNRGTLESPFHGGLVSGIGFISGWKCRPGNITISVDGGQQQRILAMGQPRADTQPTCGTENNGFIAQINWNHLGSGRHTMVAYDNGEEFARSTFTVGSADEEFLRSVEAECRVPDFPTPGESGRFVWNESTQHLELAEIGPPLHVQPPPSDLSRFDGTWRAWSTSSRSRFGGACETADMAGTLIISQGSISGRIVNSDTVGLIGATGAVNGHWLDWQNAPEGVFTGSLQGQTGSGNWSTTWCSGTWTATTQ